MKFRHKCWVWLTLEETDRGWIQKSILVLSKTPLFNYLLFKLSITTDVYFNQKDFEQTQILKEFYESANSYSISKIGYSEFITSNTLNSFVQLLGSNLLTLLKMIILEKKIIVFSEKPSVISQFMIAILTLFPGWILFKFNEGKKIKDYNRSISQFGFPLKLFNKKTLLLPAASIRDLKKLEKMDGYFIGTTNSIFLKTTKLKVSEGYVKLIM